MRYSVVWAVDNDLETIYYQKKFEDYNTATWFAKRMDQCYNWSTCIPSRFLTDLDWLKTY